MAATCSFDVTSTVDLQEVDNALNQARKEVVQRYDFKGSKADIEFSRQDSTIRLVADDEFKITALWEIVRGADKLLLSLALCLTALSYCLCLLRWRMLLTALGVEVSGMRMLSAYGASLFFGVLLPSTVGVDVVRSLDLAAQTKKAPEVVASVLLDRLSGFTGMALMGLVAFSIGAGDLPEAVVGRLASRLRRALRGAEGLLVADYGYGAATPALVRAASVPAALPVTVDSRGRVAAYRRAWACTPNQEEAENALGLPALASEAEVEAAGRDLLARTGNRAVVNTRGARGMSVVERRGKVRHLPAFGDGEVADVTGAGDTVIATFTLALIAGATFVEAAALANVAAGLVVMKYGTATISPGELAGALRGDLR